MGDWDGTRATLSAWDPASEVPPPHPKDHEPEPEPEVEVTDATGRRGWAGVPESRGGIPTGQPIERKPVPRDKKGFVPGPLERRRSHDAEFDHDDAT